MQKTAAVRDGIEGASAATGGQVRIIQAGIILAFAAACSGCDSFVVRHDGTEIEIHDRQLPIPAEGVRDVDVWSNVADGRKEGEK